MGCFSNDFTGTTWPGTSYETRPHMSRVSGWVAAPAARKLHCAGRVHVKTERWASGEISWPELSTITVTHRQAQGAIQARLQAPGSSMMQC